MNWNRGWCWVYFLNFLYVTWPFTRFYSCHNHSSGNSFQKHLARNVLYYYPCSPVVVECGLSRLCSMVCTIPPGCYSRFWGYRSICVPLQYVRRDQSKARSALIPKLVCPGELLADRSLAWLTSCVGELHYREIPQHACGAACTNMHVSLFL